jgi:hypothetical protein
MTAVRIATQADLDEIAKYEAEYESYKTKLEAEKHKNKGQRTNSNLVMPTLRLKLGPIQVDGSRLVVEVLKEPKFDYIPASGGEQLFCVTLNYIMIAIIQPSQVKS